MVRSIIIHIFLDSNFFRTGYNECMNMNIPNLLQGKKAQYNKVKLELGNSNLLNENSSVEHKLQLLNYMWGDDNDVSFISEHKDALIKLEEHKKTNYPGDKGREFNDMVRSTILDSMKDPSFKASYNKLANDGNVDYKTKKDNVQKLLQNREELKTTLMGLGLKKIFGRS